METGLFITLEGGDGSGADNTETRCPRHGLVKPAQFRALDGTGPVKHRPHRHKQERFIEDMREGVCGRAIDG